MPFARTDDPSVAAVGSDHVLINSGPSFFLRVAIARLDGGGSVRRQPDANAYSIGSHNTRIFLESHAFSLCNDTRETNMSKRELIDTGTDQRYVRRDENGRFKESVDVGRSLAADKRHKAKHDAKPGEGDKGDHHRKH